MSTQPDTRALAELQRDFQRHVMHGHERIVDAVDGTSSVPAILRLGIYSEAYRLRLTDALASTLPFKSLMRLIELFTTTPSAPRE